MTRIHLTTRFGNAKTFSNITREHFRTTGASADDTFRATDETGERVVLNGMGRMFDAADFDGLLAAAHKAAPLDQDVAE